MCVCVCVSLSQPLLAHNIGVMLDVRDMLFRSNDMLSDWEVRVRVPRVDARVARHISVRSVRVLAPDGNFAADGARERAARAERALRSFFTDSSFPKRLVRRGDLLLCRYDGDRSRGVGSVSEGVLFIVEKVMGDETLEKDDTSGDDATFIVDVAHASLALSGSRAAPLPRMPPSRIPRPIRAISKSTQGMPQRTWYPWYDRRAALSLASALTPLVMEGSLGSSRGPRLRIAVLVSGQEGSGRRSLVRSVTTMMGVNIVPVDSYDLLMTSKNIPMASTTHASGSGGAGKQPNSAKPSSSLAPDADVDALGVEADGPTAHVAARSHAISVDNDTDGMASGRYASRTIDVNANIHDAFTAGAEFAPAVLAIANFDAIVSAAANGSIDQDTEIDDDGSSDEDYEFDTRLRSGKRLYEVLSRYTREFFDAAVESGQKVVLVACVKDPDALSDELRRCFTHEVRII